MRFRPVLAPFAAALFITAPPLAAQAPAVAGRYDFASATPDGQAFTGTIHLYPTDGGWGGRLYTTINEPFDVQGVRVDSFITVDAGRVVFRWRPGPDSIAGQWRLGPRTGAWRGRRMPDEPGNSLRPVPCRARFLDEVVRCATLFVPENRANPDGRRIPLSIVVLPAEGPAEPDPLYHFAGGPGQAATEFADGNARRFATIRRTRDIVMVDQRGTGHSNGLYCEFTDVTERTAALFGAFFPPDVARRCAAALSVRADLRFYDTAVAALDVDTVRTWLGYARLNLYGGSYGTRAALAYLRAFPARVRTITLRGIMAPSGSLPLDNPRSAQESLERTFRACDAQPTCRAAFPALRRELTATLRRLDQQPEPVRIRDAATGDSVTLPVDRGVLAGSIRRMLMDAEQERRVPLAIHEASSGRFETIRAGIEGTVGIAGTIAWGMGLSVVCAEDPGIVGRHDIARATAGTFMGRAQVDGMLAVCREWPAGTPPRDYADPVRADVPALLFSGDEDPTTPARWGEDVARSLPNGRHFVMVGISHAPFPDCATGIMARFVGAGTTAGLDTSCLATLRRAPFALPGTDR
jgi:pimeloyl-ACP methyl ester carboxylesterase